MIKLFLALPHDAKTGKPLAFKHDGGSNAMLFESYGGALDAAANVNAELLADAERYHGTVTVHWAVTSFDWDGAYLSY